MSHLSQSVGNKRLLIIEGHDELVSFLEENIRDINNLTVDKLNNASELPIVLQRTTVNWVVLGTHLSEKSFFYWLKWFKSYYPAIPVIATSLETKPEARLAALVAGAYDYLTPPFMQEELLIKTKIFFKLNSHEDQQTLLKIGNATVDTIDACIDKNGKRIPLTKLECKILQLFYMNVGTSLSREEIMWQTMGQRYVPTNRSIDTHVNRIRMKIEDTPSSPVHIHTVRGRGYCFHLSPP